MEKALVVGLREAVRAWARWGLVSVLLFGCAGASEHAPEHGSETGSERRTTDESTITLRGVIEGPFGVTEGCGSCETGMKLRTSDGEEHAFSHQPALRETVQRCMASGATVTVTGRFTEHAGSCGEGHCRTFVADAIEE